jgi:hypothetical protein
MALTEEAECALFFRPYSGIHFKITYSLSTGYTHLAETYFSKITLPKPIVPYLYFLTQDALY